MSKPSELYALLVGIDRYHPQGRVPHLRGCVNDAEAMADLLQRKYGVAAANIHTLINEAATHQAIKQAFRQHLLGKAQAWAHTGKSGDAPAFVFHYSGHGSQARDETGTEPDGMDETLVAYDSRSPGIYDIKDWELGQLITELNQYSDNVTIILDCCHSGSGTRNSSDPAVAQTRRCAPDLRPQPSASQRPATLPATRGLSTSNWEVAGKHVLLAGCRDKEESNEYALTNGGQRLWRGAMSYFMQRELAQLPPNTVLTYRELHERIRYQVNSSYPNQMPQCEGDRDRELFGGLRPQRDAFFTVIAKRDGYLWIDAGLAHGLGAGTLLNVYPKETRTLAAAGAALAQLRIEEEGAVQSGCTVEHGDPATIEINARCVLQQISYSNMQRSVALAIDDTALRAAVQQRLSPQSDSTSIDISAYVRVDEQDAAHFRVAHRNDQLEIQDGSGKALVAAVGSDNLDGLAADLAHLARYANALELRNSAPHSELAGMLQLRMKELAFDPTTQQPIAKELPRTAGGELINTVGMRIVLEVTNQSAQALYFALFDFSPDWAVSQIYPSAGGAHEALQAGRTLSLGLSNRRSEQLMAQLPTGMVEGRDLFKVIATVKDTSFEMLEQGALKTPFDGKKAVRSSGRPLSALDQILQNAMTGEKTRAYGAPPASVEDEWTTAELEVITVQSLDQMTQSLHGGARTVLPAFAIAVEPPPGFEGKVRMMTERQSTRAANNTLDLQLPPGIAPYPAQFAPVMFAATRAAAPSGAFLEIEADDSARQQITPATPLDLHLTWPVDRAEPIFAVAFDGSFYYPVGRNDDDPQTVHVEWLPAADAEAVTPLRSTRGVGRIIKLYLYKMIGIQEDQLGLQCARFVSAGEIHDQVAAPGETERKIEGGVVYYRRVEASQFRANERVAVAVHGFGADSKELAAWLCREPNQNGIPYDHVLTFDYESFNTGVSENGQKLANALRAAQLDQIPGLQVDLFAHSMGTVITRCMVELWGGDEFVSRCFLAGPPNQGTRLAEAKKYVSWVTTLALNQVALWTPTAIGGWILNKAAEDAFGPEDMRPNSQILHDLNTSTKPSKVPYFILAGHNNRPLHLDATAWQRLKYKVMGDVDLALDAIFGDQNDLVIAVQSMLSIRNGQYPTALLKTAELACTHFEYFTDERSQQQLIQWLRHEQS